MTYDLSQRFHLVCIIAIIAIIFMKTFHENFSFVKKKPNRNYTPYINCNLHITYDIKYFVCTMIIKSVLDLCNLSLPCLSRGININKRTVRRRSCSYRGSDFTTIYEHWATVYLFSFIDHILPKLRFCHKFVHTINFLATFLLLTTNTTL